MLVWVLTDLNIQMMAAVQAGAAYLVTRNISDYRAGPLPALQPAEQLTLL